MKVVFLDFDGVINRNSGRWLVELVERLNRITDQTGTLLYSKNYRFPYQKI